MISGERDLSYSIEPHWLKNIMINAHNSSVVRLVNIPVHNLQQYNDIKLYYVANKIFGIHIIQPVLEISIR